VPCPGCAKASVGIARTRVRMVFRIGDIF